MSGGYVDPNWPNPNGEGDSPFIIYGYTPSKAAAILAIVLFGIALILNIVQTVRLRVLFFSIPFTIGTLLEIVGYAFRTCSATINPYRVVFFIVQYFFIVVAPVLFSAAIYTILSALIARVGREYSPVFPPKWIVGIFVACDVVATIVQIVGAALIGVAESNREESTTPNNILLGGLAFQSFSFLIYLILLSIFLVRAWRGLDKIFLSAYIAATLLIYLRTVFRLAETAEGVYGHLMTHEGFFIGLEFVPVIVAVFLLTAWHPGNYLKQIV